jgi:hypothetical protein
MRKISLVALRNADGLGIGETEGTLNDCGDADFCLTMSIFSWRSAYLKFVDFHVANPLSGKEWTKCRTLGKQSHRREKKQFSNTTSRIDVRKARMNLFGEKKKNTKLESELLCHFQNHSN